MDTGLNAGHFRSQAHALAAGDDPLVKSLMTPVRRPTNGRARYTAAIDRATQNTQNANND
jgi:glycyl-tRNA synthetase alpha subunit